MIVSCPPVLLSRRRNLGEHDERVRQAYAADRRRAEGEGMTKAG
jgi:hypothetical protein